LTSPLAVLLLLLLRRLSSFTFTRQGNYKRLGNKIEERKEERNTQ
jgi:hypothetical protein